MPANPAEIKRRESAARAAITEAYGTVEELFEIYILDAIASIPFERYQPLNLQFIIF